MTAKMEAQGSVSSFPRLRGFHRRKGIRNIKSQRKMVYNTDSEHDILFSLSDSQTVISHTRLETQAYFHEEGMSSQAPPLPNDLYTGNGC